MAGVDRPDERDLPAGDFSAWLTEMQSALRGERGSDVPCDGCTACCTSSQFIEIGPDETDTLAHIPAELLFPAPRRPPGHAFSGTTSRGIARAGRRHVLDLRARPTTCRTYDCRVFPAAGVDHDGDGTAMPQGADRPTGAAVAVQLSHRRRPEPA